MKRTILLISALCLALCFSAGCSCCAGKTLDALEESAVSVIEFFPEGPNRDPFTKPERIHLNFQYDTSGNDLIIKVDHWHFKNEGRKNMLQVFTVPMSKVDPESIEIVPVEMPVGPVSYHRSDEAKEFGVAPDVEPLKIVIQTVGAMIVQNTLDRGTGPAVAQSEADRFHLPDDGVDSRKNYKVEIYARNQTSAQHIVDVIQDCL